MPTYANSNQKYNEDNKVMVVAAAEKHGLRHQFLHIEYIVFSYKVYKIYIAFVYQWNNRCKTVVENMEELK